MQREYCYTEGCSCNAFIQEDKTENREILLGTHEYVYPVRRGVCQLYSISVTRCGASDPKWNGENGHLLHWHPATHGVFQETQALFTAPTQELASQIHQVTTALADYLSV
uniref:DUF3109 family protein n=1 Tax=Mesocestoides corti TaxID=53468 RepID=A0A5K3FSC1_MESCO